MHAVRRTRPRLVTNLKVTYRNERCSGIGYTLDLSMGGLFLQTSDSLAKGESLELMFHVPVEGQRKPVRCSGRIVHLRAPQEVEEAELEPGVGLEFHSIPQGAGELRSYLSARLGLPLGAIGEPATTGARHVLTPGLADEIAPAAARPRPAADASGSRRVDASSNWQRTTPLGSPRTGASGAPQRKAGAERSHSAGRNAGPPSAMRLLRLSAQTVIVITCLFILAHVLMKLRVIPWDLTSWSETRWLSDEFSESPDDAEREERRPQRPRRRSDRPESDRSDGGRSGATSESVAAPAGSRGSNGS
jgi:hypothetical protein